MDQSTEGAPGSLLSPPELTPLEQDVLDEYEKLAENMKKVRLLHTSFNSISNSCLLRSRGGRQFAKQAPSCGHSSQLTVRLSLACLHSGPPGLTAQRRDSRWTAGSGAQDEFSIHSAQGECVQHRSTARDRLGRWRPQKRRRGWR